MPTRSTSIVEFLSPRQKIIDAVTEGSDVIYTCPKYCLGEQLLQSIMAVFAAKKSTRCAYLTPRLKATTDEVDYTSIWQSLAVQLRFKSKTVPETSKEFSAALDDALAKVTGKVIVFLKVFGTGREDQSHLLLYKFNRRHMNRRDDRINFVCLDDFSFWFYENYLSGIQGVQSQIGADHVLYSSVSGEELRSLIAASLGWDPDAPKTRSVTEVIERLSGGHIGLVGQMCDHVQRQSKALDADQLARQLRQLALQGETLEGLRRDIEEDPIGLAQTAMECVEPAIVVENSSPRYQRLRQLGILQVHGPAELLLCPGIIREFVEGISKARPQPRLGTVETNYGMREFVDKEPTITDDDFVVVHLSDLHVGDEYGYRLPLPGGGHNGKEPLTDLIVRDLNKMKIGNRVDALVLSGDLVCTGDYDEFYRALDIVRDMMDALRLDKDALLVIPGNHDLKWKPGKHEPREAGREVSMDPFQRFLDGLRKEKFALCNVMPIVSRSKRNKLRLVGIDSNDVEGPDAGGIGYVSKDTLTRVEKLLEVDPIDGFSGVNTWLVVHHHVLPVTSAPRADAQKKKISVMGNAQDLIAAASNWNVEAILHGHEHQPSVTWAQRWAGQRRGAPQGICVIGAGSCGVARNWLGPIAQNHYYVLVKTQNDILIRSRVIADDGIAFTSHNDIVIKSKPIEN